MSTFLDLYGNALDIELGSADRTSLFTTARRKAAINAAQQEFVKRTGCLTDDGEIPLVDETQEYDPGDTLTNFGDLSPQGWSIRITPATGSIRYLEGDDLRLTTIQRLDVEEPNWKAESAGTPRAIFFRRQGGALGVGLHPAPSITAGDTWDLLLKYVAIPADMVADTDAPFRLVANVLQVPSLKFWHRALPFYAAYELEKLRKDTERSLVALKMFDAQVEDYTFRMKPKPGQQVRMAVNYRSRSSRSNGRMDPRVWP